MSKLNLDFYDGNSLFVYSFLKDIDSTTVDLLKNTKDFDKFYDIKEKISPDVFYFTSPDRIFSIGHFNFTKEDEVLEINSCFGILTQFLSEKVKHVTAIEFAKQNAEIANERLKEKENIEIIVGNINKMKFEKKFDYIILTDILEFSNFFFSSINPSREFISFCKNLLKPNGTIILQIYNRFGINNLLGEKDEHTSKNFDAITDYRNFSLKAFSKKDLEDLFNSVGFEFLKFYYPVPNHYFSIELYSDEEISSHKFVNYSPKINHMLLTESKKRKEFDFMANSFVVTAKNYVPDEILYYSKVSGPSVTSFVRNKTENKKYSKKFVLDNKYKIFIDNTYKYYFEETKRLQELGLDNVFLVKPKFENDYISFEWIEGTDLSAYCRQNYNFNNLEDCQNIVSKYIDFVYKLYPDIEIMDFYPGDYFSDFKNYKAEKVPCAKNINFDLSFSNIIKNDDKYAIIDYDIVFSDYFPVKMLIVRALMLEGFFKNEVLSDYIIKKLNLTLSEYETYVDFVKKAFNIKSDIRFLLHKK